MDKTNQVAIKISDTGCGMDLSQRDRLFEKFTQVTSDASKKKLGTGLGLFISKQLCQRMGGEIRVFSRKDKGSCFTFCLPIEVVEDEQFIDLESLKAIVRAKKLTAMIVDDAPFNHLICKLLCVVRSECLRKQTIRRLRLVSRDVFLNLTRIPRLLLRYDP